jgi:hypothetical protein
MKRLLLVVIVVALVALAIVYGLRHAKRTSPAAVTVLLPRETILFAHVPDFNRTRAEWHESDIYKLYREPAVQDFLQKPLRKLPEKGGARQILQEIEQLDPKDAFVAVTSIDNNNPQLAVGFRYKGGAEKVRTNIITPWCLKMFPNTPKSGPETFQYQHHDVYIFGASPNQLATAYARDWFFASNNLAELKATLDRVDGRALTNASPSQGAKDRQSSLEADEAFRAAIAHMPRSYAVLFYLQPKILADKLRSLRTAIGQQAAANQPTFLEQVHSICGTTWFDKGKIHDVFFAGVPKLQPEATLTRSSVALGTTDTFFYLATLLSPQNLGVLGQAGGIGPLGNWLQKFLRIISDKGITAEDWKAAFGIEAASLADWPADSHWPSLIAAFPVKDLDRANKLVGMITVAIDEDARWTKTEKDGVSYFFMATPASLFAITPTIALSDRVLVIGLDSVSVEGAIKRSQSSGPRLSNSETYKGATRSLPAPTNFFAYIDTPLLYSRLDAVLRPMLVLGAAFMPAVSDRVDLAKLPASETVVKHLSPIVSSQRYDGNGYVAESVGPITFNQAMLGVGIAAIYLTIARQPAH